MGRGEDDEVQPLLSGSAEEELQRDDSDDGKTANKATGKRPNKLMKT